MQQLSVVLIVALFFFFQAEDGIRDKLVTGVQTCALPISTAGLKGRIVFHSTRAGTFDIFVMNADGTGVTQLTNTTYQDDDAFWSPNGQRIAFNSFDNTVTTLHIVNMNAAETEDIPLHIDAF